ncbi:MAG: type IV pilus assembly protein PilM [Candidatus Scalindua sp.]
MLDLNFLSFLKKGGGGRLIGIDIGSYCVKVLELDLTKADREIKGLAKKELPPEMRQGERDPAAVAEVIKECLAEGGISAKNVVIMVSGPQVFIRRITMPPMPQEELAEVIPFEATKHVSFSVEQLEVDYIIVGEKEVDGVKNQDILLVATPKEVVEQQKSIIRAAGLRPVAVTVAPMVLWKTFQLSKKAYEEKVIALLDIGCESTAISLLNNGILEFTRAINLGGGEVTSSLMTELLVTGEGGSRTLTYEEAEDIKREYGLPPSTAIGTTTKEGMSLDQIPRLMRPFLEKLLSEIRTSFSFYVTEFQIPQVDKIIMSGGGALLKGLKEFLSSELGIEVELADPFQGVNFAGGMSEDDLASFAPAFVMPMGLAAWNKGDLSLSRKRAAKMDPGLIKALGVPPGVAALIVICFYFYLSSNLSDGKTELDKRTQEVASLSPISTAVMTLSAKKRRLQSEINALPQALSESVDSAGILEEIRRAIPDNTRLERINIIPLPGKKLIRIYGTAFFLGEKGPSMSDFMAALKDSPLFNDVRMLSVEEDKSYTTDGLRFEFNFQYVNEIGGG